MNNQTIDNDKISAAGQTELETATEGSETGKVILTGVLSSPADKEAVEQAVRSCNGVSYVENHIHVQPQAVR